MCTVYYIVAKVLWQCTRVGLVWPPVVSHDQLTTALTSQPEVTKIPGCNAFKLSESTKFYIYFQLVNYINNEKSRGIQHFTFALGLWTPQKKNA